ncbi:hypothetical protein ACFQE5_12240 [Pseudonocardia hispaniensis]|uniref:Uncharacterized protein n=1 Tax=Pseudonocardia hispaniensis TaxID=904933 RepID=A0ABW1J3J1_9PSEU
MVTRSSALPRPVPEAGSAEAPSWSTRLLRLLEEQVRAAVADGLLTTAEAEQLLARLALVIDQATTPARP